MKNFNKISSENTFRYDDGDGFDVFGYKWSPTDGKAPKAAIQIAHGGCEHSGRYDEFAAFLNIKGFVVYASDLRGHGRTKGNAVALGGTGTSGWDGLVKNLSQTTEYIRNDYPDLPIFIYGHSLGAHLLQRYIQLYGDKVLGCIISGAGIKFPDVGVDLTQDKDGYSASIADVDISGNAWLSRDEDVSQEVDGDPLYTLGAMELPFLCIPEGPENSRDPKNEALIDKSTSILLLSGGNDLVTNMAEYSIMLYKHYRKLGIKDTSLKIYCDARHELLKELNKEEVMQDITTWIGRVMEDEKTVSSPEKKLNKNTEKKLDENVKTAFSKKTKLGVILSNPEAKEVFDRIVPGLSGHPMINMGKGMALDKVAGFPQAKMSPETLEKLIEELNKL